MKERFFLSSRVFGGEPVTVHWLSRHELNQRRQIALELAQGRPVNIIQRPGRFRDAEDFCRLVTERSRSGFVYLVAPQYMIREATKRKFEFGLIQMDQLFISFWWCPVQVIHFNGERWQKMVDNSDIDHYCQILCQDDILM
ncbi:MAG: hypothetical protein ACOCU8_01850 [Patescibacteria group bacterium]